MNSLVFNEITQLFFSLYRQILLLFHYYGKNLMENTNFDWMVLKQNIGKFKIT